MMKAPMQRTVHIAAYLEQIHLYLHSNIYYALLSLKTISIVAYIAHGTRAMGGRTGLYILHGATRGNTGLKLKELSHILCRTSYCCGENML